MPDLNLQLRDQETGEIIPITELDDDTAIRVLQEAEITGAELVPWGSNHTFAVVLEGDGISGHLAIYKPRAGERPLHDFPHGTLYLRERASYVLSRALGWGIVAPTVLRDGPYGVGSVQIYIPSKPEYMEDADFWGERTVEIERMVLFDHIANNADRKMTHCLVSASGKVIGIDHGLTFNHLPKLRTVLWQFSGRRINEDLRRQLEALAATMDDSLAEFRDLLLPEERDAFRRRLEGYISSGRYPLLDPRRNVPYGWW